MEVKEVKEFNEEELFLDEVEMRRLLLDNRRC